MNPNEASLLLSKYLHNKNLLKHSYAAQAAMKGVYRRLNDTSKQNPEDEEKWGITGLLHDVDYELAQETSQLDKHGLLIFDKEPNVIPEDIAHAIKSHNFENTRVEPQAQMDWAITASDQLTGLIVAAALVHPERKLAPLTTESVMKRFKEKSFAKGADRKSILYCEEKLSIPLQEFIEIVLKSMQSISVELGL